MNRVFELIDKQTIAPSELLKEILKIEQVFISNDGTGAKDKIQALISKAAKEAAKP